ncbi:MBL fold metallo-hydrolase RNA specificity domain-containing protein [Ferrimonas marina]|uniref:Metallo-beta-lactamase family protein n=1 Tax=Ferrimonas marina TaxID=299255 RepID=A0A1M5YTR9_9GAMM|nr:MBL fold metallo-hydrolase [Ferrimonas marina]SHI15456.1 metallo-beta-lactamase family protein [Ferrimonas marina]
MLTLTSYGAAREVTGSRHLLDYQGRRILLDCGLHQGRDQAKRLKRDSFGFRPAQLDAVVLSHAHLDHSGALPRLIKRGFRGPIYCTGATLNLLAVMLKDACDLYLRELERDNKVRQRKGQRTQPPLYGMEEVLAVLEACKVLPFNQWQALLPGVELRLLDAGHILGAAMVQLHFDTPEGPYRLLYSGDLGNSDSPLMRDPAPPPEVDLVLMESTYGNRNHRSYQDTLTELSEVLAQAQGGVVLVPAFAVGRTQELLFQLGVMYHQGLLDGWHVVLDSPMAIEVTRIYDQWLELLDPEDLAQLSAQQSPTLEDFLPCLHLTPETEASMGLNRVNLGLIVVAGAGMCNGGRILHHFKHRIWNDKTQILFTGFQAQGTLGRQLVEGAKTIRLFGNSYAVRAQIHTLGGFSAHADQRQLLQWLASVPGQPQVKLVHGEWQAQQALQSCIEQQLGLSVDIPEAEQTQTLVGTVAGCAHL